MMRVWMAPLGLHIEPAQTGDAKALAEIHGESFARGWAAAEFEAYIDDPKTLFVFIACDGSRKIAGFAVFRIAAEEAELLSIVIRRKWRGKGVGKALLRAARDDLRAGAVRHMFLEVEDGNRPALALYKASGFVEIGRRDAYYPKPGGDPATALIMRADIV
jgi:[ribosomal protein S18]-alanine N-acetyltransferase